MRGPIQVAAGLGCPCNPRPPLQALEKKLDVLRREEALIKEELSRTAVAHDKQAKAAAAAPAAAATSVVAEAVTAAAKVSA